MARELTAPGKLAKYKVTRLLPHSDGAQFRYCLKHEEALFYRLAWERDLIGVIGRIYAEAGSILPDHTSL
jgi:hypothetical protein